MVDDDNNNRNEKTMASRAIKKDLDMLGVSVQWLKTGFMKEVRNSGFDYSAKVYDIEPTVIRGKGKDIACPIDGRQGSSYVHALLELSTSEAPISDGMWCCFNKPNHIPTDAVGPANYMLSYGWGYKVKDIVDTLADYCASNNLDPTCSTYVWICCLCNNQHRVVENRSQGKIIPFEEFRHTFYSHVTGIKNVLALMSPWQKPLHLTRIWCIFELYTAYQHEDCNLIIIMPPKEREALKDDLFSAPCKGIDALYEALSSTKIQNAKASVESDRLTILKLIEDSGQDYDVHNHMVNDLLRTWVLREITSLAEEWNSTEESSKQSKTEAANIFNNIGNVLSKLGEPDAALVEFRKAVSICEAELGKDHISTAKTYNNIVTVLLSQGKYDAALAEHRKALAIKEVVLGKDHPDTALSYSNIGSILCTQGNYNGALVEFRNALVIRKAVLERDHPDTAQSYNNIGGVLYKQGNYDDALVKYRKALAIFEAVLGEDHPSTATLYNNIGSLLSDQGNYEDALVELRKALKIREAVLGNDHPDTARSCNNIGFVLKKQGNYVDALVEYRKSLVIRELVVLGKKLCWAKIILLLKQPNKILLPF